MGIVAVLGSVDDYATRTADGLFKRALTTYAITRTFNGVISVAQGTEIAVQPVGIGVTISAGQILDPLNDLIERFSWLVLAASASLGLQLLATEMFAHQAVTVVVVGTLIVMLIALWSERFVWREQVLKFGTTILFLRFVFALVTLTGALISETFLEQKQSAAIADIERVSEVLQQQDPVVAEPAPDGLLERIDQLVSSSTRSWDIEARLQRLADQAETAIAALINLITLFVMQTVVLPLALLWAAAAILRWLWRAWPTSSTPP